MGVIFIGITNCNLPNPSVVLSSAPLYGPDLDQQGTYTATDPVKPSGGVYAEVQTPEGGAYG